MGTPEQLHGMADLAIDLANDFPNLEHRGDDVTKLGCLLQRYWRTWDADFPYIVSAANTGDLSLLSEPLLRNCSVVIRMAAEQAAKDEVAAGVNTATARSTAPAADEGTKVETPGYMTPRELAEAYKLPIVNTQKALAGWRRNHGGSDGYIENTERRPTEAEFLYKREAVHPVLARLQELRTKRNLRWKKSSS